MAHKDGQEKPETSIIMPRNYGIAINSGTSTYFYDPARYVIGHAILATQPRIFRWLKKWQGFKKRETKRKLEGKLHYVPKFPVEGIEDLLECPVEEIENILIAKIQRVEGSKNLWEVGVRRAVIGAKLYGISLEGMVKSKEKGYVSTHINRPWTTDEGLIQHTDIYCSAPEGDYESQKGLRVMCSHAAALETAQFMQLKRMDDFSIEHKNRNIRNINPTLVFDFVSNPFLSNLEVDVLIAHYIKGENFYSINRRLTDISEHYSAALNRTGETGKARFVVMRQKSIESEKGESYQELENKWVNSIREKIRELGFRRMHYYTLVFKESPFEAIAERYEKNDEAIEIACSPENPPIVVKKTLQGDVNFHNSSKPYEKN